jgi:hypothetical protein
MPSSRTPIGVVRFETAQKDAAAQSVPRRTSTVIRTVGLGGLALAAGLWIGLASGAGADQPVPSAPTGSKTPIPCLLALESAWKTINQLPDGVDHRGEFDASYAECLQAS